MDDPAIEDFFEKEVKEAREDWLPEAAKKAKNRAFATHPSKFSHPDTGVGKTNKRNQTYVSPVISSAQKTTDGFLRSGNVMTERDTIGNAAALKVEKFLKLRMADGDSLLEHIRAETDLAKRLLNIKSESYESLREGLLAIEKPASEVATSSKIKQVYFPVPSGYHQLSILSNSGMIYELKNRINNIRFSDEAKELKKMKRNNSYSSQKYSVRSLTHIGYGGAQPQNISTLNTKIGGKAYLLQSAPPPLNKRSIRFPKQNFFRESFHYYEYRDVFEALHNLFKTNYNNKSIREGRDYRLQDLMDRIVDRMWAVRAVCKEQYRPENSHLDRHQKIWLCDEFQQTRQTREEEHGWLDKLCKEISRWIVFAYEKVLGKSAYKLGEPEHRHIHKIVTDNREVLR